MTTQAQAREALYQAFVTGWVASSQSAVPYTFDNEQFTPPEAAPWVRVTVRHRFSGQETLGAPGNRRFERLGVVLVQIFLPLDSGTAVADSITGVIRSIFEGVSLAGTTVHCQAVSVVELGPEGKWHQVLASGAFTYDETR